MLALIIIVSLVLTYASGMAGAGYVAALAGVSGVKKNTYDDMAPRTAMILLGPVGLFVSLGLYYALKGARRAELEAARHKAALAAVEPTAKEIEQTLERRLLVR